MRHNSKPYRKLEFPKYAAHRNARTSPDAAIILILYDPNMQISGNSLLIIS